MLWCSVVVQPLISEDVYQFTPARESIFWPWAMGLVARHFMLPRAGIESVEVQGGEKIRKAIDAGHGIIIAPNHCRPCDPLVLSELAREIGVSPYMMASAHLFRSRWMRWLLPRVGAFSMNREGMDRESLRLATSILTAAKRPLVIFPEGVITRTNDRVIHLQEGVSFLARNAAKACRERGGEVVIFPLAMRYHFKGNWQDAVKPVVEKLERRFGWKKIGGTWLERVTRLGHGLLVLKAVEYFGVVQQGTLEERLARFMEGVLQPMEREFLAGRSDGSVVMRVKNLRKALLPELVAGELDTIERERRWKLLFDLEVAQQAYHFPPDYIAQNPSPERIIETVERYEEALGEPSPVIHGPMKAILTVGDAMMVAPKREKGTADSLMEALRERLQELLACAQSE
jgi:1-acyl-sn-glycerol-3-phosphate acyltransferase